MALGSPRICARSEAALATRPRSRRSAMTEWISPLRIIGVRGENMGLIGNMEEPCGIPQPGGFFPWVCGNGKKRFWARMEKGEMIIHEECGEDPCGVNESKTPGTERKHRDYGEEDDEESEHEDEQEDYDEESEHGDEQEDYDGDGDGEEVDVDDVELELDTTRRPRKKLDSAYLEGKLAVLMRFVREAREKPDLRVKREKKRKEFRKAVIDATKEGGFQMSPKLLGLLTLAIQESEGRTKRTLKAMTKRLTQTGGTTNCCKELEELRDSFVSTLNDLLPDPPKIPTGGSPGFWGAFVPGLAVVFLSALFQGL